MSFSQLSPAWVNINTSLNVIVKRNYTSLSVIPFNNDISLSSNTSADGFSNVG